MKQYQVVFMAAALCMLASRAFAFDPLFNARVDYGVGSSPYSICAADFDGDAKPDMAVANWGSNNVAILKNNGNGTFSAAVYYDTGLNAVSVISADFDRDGHLDLAVANENSDNVSILRNNGDGTFASAVSYGTGSHPYSVSSADFDGDGDLDLAVANYNSNTVSILKNNGNGKFAAAINYASGDGSISIVSADFDGDGDVDLAAANAHSDDVSILKNNGNGTFAAPVSYGAGPGPYSIFAADLDGDADSDLAVANFHADYISVLRNNGDGTFAAKVDYSVGSYPLSVFSADLDKDGYFDLLVANSGSDNVSVLKNNGDGSFAAVVDYSTGSYPCCVLSADFDGDGDGDLVVANENVKSVSIVKNNGDGTFASAVNYAVSDLPFTIFSADFDGDGHFDLVTANYNSNSVSILRNNGDGSYAPAVGYSTGFGPYSVFSADYDSDGDFDLAVPNSGANNVSILKNNGDGAFAAAINYVTGVGPNSVFSADFDSDGDLDLATGNCAGSVSILKNNGDGTFSSAANYITGYYPICIYSVDFDRDGHPDLVTANYSNTVSVLKNNGDGTFAAAVEYSTGTYPYCVFSADFDNDGDFDLAVANYDSDNVSILMNNGDGTFAAAVNYVTGQDPHSVYSADYDGDGDFDLAVANSGANDVSILLNNGDGTFGAPIDYGTGVGPNGVFSADFDGDGDLDLATANRSNSVSILINIMQQVLTLVSPPYNYGIENYTTLSWQPLAGAEYFQISLSTTPQMNALVWTRSTALNSYEYHPGPEMEPQATYYWSVRAYIDGSWTRYATARAIRKAFTPNPLDPPVALTPIDGAGIALPDYFSWAMPSGASKVLFEISDSPSFANVVGKGEAIHNYVLIPRLTAGNVYYWHLKAIGEGTESDWSETESFLVLASTSPPSSPERISPLDDETIGSNSVGFSWNQSPGATNYYLDISISPDFPVGSDKTWTVGPVHATGKLVEILPTNATLYWKVSAANSAGKGSPSTVGYFHVANAMVPLSSARIINPPDGMTVSQGGGSLANGLVTGCHAGAVTVDWLLDGIVFESYTYEMDGKGFETESASVPTTDLGSHELTLRVTGPSTVTSPARSFTVVEREYGEPYKISLVAIDHAMEMSSNTKLICCILDSSGRLVENDSGRGVTISLNGGGSVDPSEIVIKNGWGEGTYTSPTEVGSVTVTAGDGALIGDEIQISVEYAGLAVLKARAHAYLNRLGTLTWDSYASSSPNMKYPKSFDVSGARTFVDNCHAGDEQRLERLNLFLRLVDRAYYYNPDKNNTYPGDDKFVYGVQTAYDDVAQSAGHVSILVAGAANALDRIGQKVEWFNVCSVVKSEIMEWLSHFIKKGVAKLVSDGGRRERIITGVGAISEMAQTYVDDPSSGGIAVLLTDFGLRSSFGSLLVERNFVQPLQEVMNDVVETLDDPSWEGGDDTRAILQTEYAIGRVGDFTADAHREYLSTEAGYNLGFVKCVDTVLELGTVTTYGLLFKLGIALTKSNELAIYLATALDCCKLADDAATMVELTTYQCILPYYEPSLAGAPVADATTHGSANGLDDACGGDELPRLETNAAIPMVLSLASEHTAQYEDLLRSLEWSIHESDTVGARTTLDSLYVSNRHLIDDRSNLYGPIFAAYDHGRLTIAGLSDSLDSSGNAGSLADSLKLELFEFSEMWLSDSGDESTRLLALQHVGREVDTYKNFIDAMNGTILQLLTTPAVPSLVITNVQIPDRAFCGTTVSMSADIQNLGAGTAKSVSAIVQTDTSVVRSATSYEVNIDSIMAGAKVHVDWQLSFVSMNLPPDSVYSVPLMFLAGGANALMDFKQVAVPLMKNPTTGVDPSKKTPKNSLVAVYPNPFNPVTTIVFSIPELTRVRLVVFDMVGRVVATIVDRQFEAGRYSVPWNGENVNGTGLSSGVYVLRLEAGDFVATHKLVLLR